ncbi:MAG: STAS domain-containing protein [Undibacterium sp.]|nr:STAS domain-containing protein [Undibacterium sp.]
MSVALSESLKLSDQELSLRNAVAISEAGLAAIRAGAEQIDLSALTIVDSSSVAVMLAWQRCAQAQGRKLAFVGAPDSLRSLIGLYGLSDFFQLQNASAASRH